ncbi:HET-domain-containing protein [Pholiota conissans]|uniref:HET-domain-containing protein n=1 Tax=Pholiota conissans TaxID=109636 RepID=A0A9P6CM77_9AGAR|nr:HET-domain-containing protein [Pholiota conissans]
MEEIQSPSRHLVCDSCWNGIFSVSGWQTVLDAKQIPGGSPYSRGYSYKTTWEEIRAAADHCTWCRFLSRPNRKGDVEVRGSRQEDSDCTPSGEKTLTISTGGGSVNSGSEYYMYTSKDDNAAKFVAARERIRDVTTPESFDLALQLFHNCTKNHPNCPKPAEDTALPDRVIDCTDTELPRVVITRGQRGRYIALSYVWGASQPMMTTTHNIERYCTDGLDVTQLPQTVRDAIIVTRNLGERYLWIDAHCILQDSNEDKARQLGMMSAIYRHSYLTISAACANAATEGFLRRNRPHKVPSARIPYRCPDGTDGMVWIARRRDTNIPDASHSYWDELEPMSFRGWCFQERMLPPRSLIYATDTLKYYCQTETANIGGALCEPSTGMRLPNAIYHSQHSVLSDTALKIYRQAWLAALFVYTLRAISVPTDKLAAMAGLVEEFQRVFEDDYLAGLWRKTLLFDLLWSAEIAAGVASRPILYRAPSWSWAAIDGLISAPYREDNIEMSRAEIIQCSVTPKERSVPFGEVTAGELKLKTYLLEVSLESDGSVITTNNLERGLKSIKIGSIRHDAGKDRSGRYYIVPLLWNSRDASMEGLIVTRRDDRTYQRVGYFHNEYGPKSIKWMDGLDQEEFTIV